MTKRCIRCGEPNEFPEWSHIKNRQYHAHREKLCMNCLFVLSADLKAIHLVETYLLFHEISESYPDQK